MIKTISQIRKWIETELPSTHPQILINEKKEIPIGQYYDFKIGDTRFCLIIQDLKDDPKVNWIFHRSLTTDEKAFWSYNYQFKLDEHDLKYAKSTLRIGEILNQEPIKFVMSRQVKSLRIFKKDLRWIIRMEERIEK